MLTHNTTPVTDQVGRLLMLAIEGQSLTAPEAAMLRSIQPTGITLFRRNLSPDAGQIRSLTQAIQAESTPDRPFLIAIDQEGGRVSRLGAPFPNLGPAMDLAGGRCDAEALASIESYGYEVGCGLRELGIRCNFAPVADVLSEESNLAIGDRSFARVANQASLRAGRFLKGMTKAGVLGCLKHFPGQGAALADTHFEGATINAPLERLMERDVFVFRELLPEAPMVMMSHCTYPALDPLWPASLSPKVISELLLQKMGFAGVVVSDDMNMAAISQDAHKWEDALVKAVTAGTHLLLICQGFERCWRAYRTLLQKATTDAAWEHKIREANQRIQGLLALLDI